MIRLQPGKTKERNPVKRSRQVWFHGSKVGNHGAHFFEDREEGGMETHGQDAVWDQSPSQQSQVEG
eukprot:8733728-Heterocapsa_arctica.AAC.1